MFPDIFQAAISISASRVQNPIIRVPRCQV